MIINKTLQRIGEFSLQQSRTSAECRSACFGLDKIVEKKPHSSAAIITAAE